MSPLPGPLTLGKGPFPRFNSGRHLLDGDSVNQISGAIGSNESGKIAGIGGTRAAAYPIVAACTQFSTVTSANDACVLPVAYPGCECYILNSDAANSLQVFANGSDTINATAGATGVALANGAAALFKCVVAGNWRRFVSA
jgi:hypothetical protein